MVSVSLSRSASNIGSMFEDMDIVNLAATGAVALGGFAVSAIGGAIASDLSGFDSGRPAAAITAGSSLAVGMTSAAFGGGFGDAMAIGALVVFGMSAIAFVLGGPDSYDPNEIRQVVAPQMVSGSVTSSAPSGCSTCKEPQTPTPQRRRVSANTSNFR